MTTQAQRDAAMKLAIAVAEAIRSLGEVPSGHLYARLMGTISLDDYNVILEALQRTKLIKVDRSHLITWIGPKDV